MTRVIIGDHIRLYGFPGRYLVTSVHGTQRGDFMVKPMDSDGGGFSSPDSSVVEINGLPTPCLSAPISPPASDYPHKPQFLYSDGP